MRERIPTEFRRGLGEPYKAPTPPSLARVRAPRKTRGKKKRATKKAFFEGLNMKELRRLARVYGAKGRSKADLVDALRKKTWGVPIEEIEQL